MPQITDQQRIDFLEKIFKHNRNGLYRRITLRQSVTGRGMRLHHTYDEQWKPNFGTVRQVIDNAIKTGIE